VSSGKTWTGIPIIAANMDTTGTFEMAKVFAKHKMLVAMSKHIPVEEVTPPDGSEHVLASLHSSLTVSRSNFQSVPRFNACHDSGWNSARRTHCASIL
jgi:hypothetical protein